MTYSLLLWILTLKKVFKQRSHLWHGIIMDADFIHVADFPDHEERLSGVLGKCFWMAACLKKKFIGHYFLLIIYLLEPGTHGKAFSAVGFMTKNTFC